jgi:hypothetical protein
MMPLRGTAVLSALTSDLSNCSRQEGMERPRVAKCRSVVAAEVVPRLHIRHVCQTMVPCYQSQAQGANLWSHAQHPAFGSDRMVGLLGFEPRTKGFTLTEAFPPRVDYLFTRTPPN